MKESQYIILPNSILFSKFLSSTEKIVYSVLNSLANNEKNYCFASNEFISNLCNIKIRQLQYILKKLESNKLIIIEYLNNKRIIKTDISTMFENQKNNVKISDKKYLKNKIIPKWLYNENKSEKATEIDILELEKLINECL